MKNLLAALTFGLSAAAALGCGPYFPESYLAFETPRTGDFDLACHIKALAEHFHPDMPIVPKPAKNVSTAEGTRLDFLAAAAAAGTPARSGQQPRLLRQSRPLETGGIAVYGEEAQRSRKRILPQDADDPAAGSADSEYGDFLLFHSFSPAMRL